MCSQAKSVDAPQIQTSAGNDPPKDGQDARFHAALEELAEAVSQKHVEPICTAYQQLRRASRGMSVREMFKLADAAVGKAVRDVIISAYSHRHCFMCNGGIVACSSCRGSGLVEEGRKCLACDGLGVTPCDFCRGTGWADRDSIPHEIRLAVLELQLKHTQAEQDRIYAAMVPLRGQLDKLKAREAHVLAGRLMRIQARLSDLANCDELADNQRIARLGTLITQTGKIIETLKNSH